MSSVLTLRWLSKADERGPQLARRPAVPGSGPGADAFEHLADVARVQRGAQMVREHQPGILPAFSGGEPLTGLAVPAGRAAPGPPPREGRGCGGRTSSPRRSWPGPSRRWPPTPLGGQPPWPGRSRRPSACARTPGLSSEHWPGTGNATPKAADLSARAPGKEEHPPLSPPTSPGHAAAEPGACPDAGQVTAPGTGLDARYEQLRHAALHARAEAFPLGLGVLTGKGVTTWRRTLADLIPAATRELIDVLAAMTLAPARWPLCKLGE
jgi:hypothetical protein